MSRPRFRWLALALCPLLVEALSADLAAQPAVKGEWGRKFDTPNVMIHVSVLPNGKVLFWGRREAGQTINPPAPRDCTPRVWDPNLGTGPSAFGTTRNTPGFNMFCGSHTFLADGRLFVAGGHIADGQGEPHATIYDPEANSWTPPGKVKDMSGGRWYPTAVTLADGGALVSFGTDEQGGPNVTQQVWKDGAWRDLTGATFINAPYYPRMHLAADGRVFMSGPLNLTQFLDPAGAGLWTPLTNSKRDNVISKDFAPSVLYTEGPDDPGKILFLGGGNGPTSDAELIDLKTSPPAWTATDPMHFKRRQHNATLLPDGTTLVTGGTQGSGAKVAGEEQGFNDLSSGQPVHTAELWDPRKPAGHRWATMAVEDVDRCYHSTAVLLPDATVLSAGGGEFSPKRDGNANATEDTHKNAQIFSPPYLFRSDGTRADRPDVTGAPDDVKYGETFTVGTTHPGDVGKVSWVRLSSVTHSFNTNQRINVLKFTADSTSLRVTAPAGPRLCPPGHYMLFVLNKSGVPSVARVIKIHP